MMVSVLIWWKLKWCELNKLPSGDVAELGLELEDRRSDGPFDKCNVVFTLLKNKKEYEKPFYGSIEKPQRKHFIDNDELFSYTYSLLLFTLLSK